MKQNAIDSSSIRVPAEWEAYDTVMVAWPHGDTDWAPMLEEVEKCYVNIVREIEAAGLRALIVTPEPKHVADCLGNIPADSIILFECQTNDTWTRDYGVISAYDGNGMPLAIDFRFDGWGLKFASNQDNLVTLRMLEKGLLTRNYVSRLTTRSRGALWRWMAREQCLAPRIAFSRSTETDTAAPGSSKSISDSRLA